MKPTATTLPDERVRVARAAPSRGRLRSRCISIDVFRTMLDEAYAIFEEHYAGTDRDRFVADLADKQFVIVLEDPASGRLCGFSTLHVRRRRDAAGRRCTVVFSGDTVIHRDWWGHGQLQREFSALLLRRKLARPWEPLYWFLITKGFRTYLLMTNYVPGMVPRHDLQPPPPKLVAMLDVVARERFGDAWDAEAGIVRQDPDNPHEVVPNDLDGIDEALLQCNAHVRYFVERNPAYATGDELACLGDLTLATMIGALARSVRRAVQRRGGRRAAVR